MSVAVSSAVMSKWGRDKLQNIIKQLNEASISSIYTVGIHFSILCHIGESKGHWAE